MLKDCLGYKTYYYARRNYMDIFEYLPQLIVAYDSNDEFANLIHVKRAKQDEEYYCPCCGGIVKPRALDSTKEQSHYYHITGKCTKESQLHFFCKNWLFEKGSKFYIDDDIFEVDSINIETAWDTPFGKYIPDITVYTSSGKTIYFEIFFSNRKTGDDYFCKWDALGNSVVEVNVKEYMCKTYASIIPKFTYLYHDGICYSKTYVKRDLYATTIAKIKNELTRQKVLNYKARIEKLDWFWQKIIKNNSKEDILKCIDSMPYEDMVSCYEIIKRKQCVSHLKKDVLDAINKKVIGNIRNSLDLPFDENIYFDIRHYKGRTYEVGIRLNIQTEHIIYNDFYLRCKHNGWNFEKSTGYPKIIFKRNMFSVEEIEIPKNKTSELKDIFNKTVEYKKKLLDHEKELSIFEDEGYKVRFNNNHYTVLKETENNRLNPILKGKYIEKLDINLLCQKIQYELNDSAEKDFLENYIKGEEAQALISDLKNYNNIDAKVYVGHKKNYGKEQEPGIYFDLEIYNGTIYSKKLTLDKDKFLCVIKSAKQKIDNFIEKYNTVIDLVSKINNCKNGFWKATLAFNYLGVLRLEIDQIYITPSEWHMTQEYIDLSGGYLSSNEKLRNAITRKMRLVMKNMEKYGYRVMEVYEQ